MTYAPADTPRPYPAVITRFLRDDERLVLSEARDMPLVIEAGENRDLNFLKTFLGTHTPTLLQDLATYGAILLRGFAITSAKDFEQAMLSIHGFQGISNAFMSEEGRVPAGEEQFVLHTNAIYKTGGTLYLGGFHSENYYSADVPSYINFFCAKPSLRGGETGLVNMERVYAELSPALQQRLEKQSYHVGKWSFAEIANRYQLSDAQVQHLCQTVNLPIHHIGGKPYAFMYKPSVIQHPLTGKKSLQINLFELATLNKHLRACFRNDYRGREWAWHRLVWRLPNAILKLLEYGYMSVASLYYSPKHAMHMFGNTCKRLIADVRFRLTKIPQTRVGSCFTQQDIKTLAQLLRKHYSSCLWQSGDILIVDNKKVAHAGMPGEGARTVRAMICNPLEMAYTENTIGCIDGEERHTTAIGHYLSTL